MEIQRTYAMIKPDAVSAGNAGKIISMIEENGFKIIHLMMFKFTEKSISQFYREHVGKDFYKGLAKFMLTDKVIGLVLEKENAIEDLRKLMGDTFPEKAEKGTIRALYGGKVPKNAIHGSDSPESARREICYVFGEFASIPSSEKKVGKEY